MISQGVRGSRGGAVVMSISTNLGMRLSGREGSGASAQALQRLSRVILLTWSGRAEAWSWSAPWPAGFPHRGYPPTRRPSTAYADSLEHGRTGLSTAFDMSFLMGHDSDHPQSFGEVGREGVAVDTVEDMQTLFDGMPLDEVSVSSGRDVPCAGLR